MTKKSQKVKQLRGIFWHRQYGICAGPCGQFVPYELATLDHKIPQSKGGNTSLENSSMMCRNCNGGKGCSV